jgi:hypothetical protein
MFNVSICWYVFENIAAYTNRILVDKIFFEGIELEDSKMLIKSYSLHIFVNR